MVVQSLDSPILAEFFQKTLKDHVYTIDISTPLGKWLKNRIEQGDHYLLWEKVLTSAQKTINDPDTRYIIRDIIYTLIQNYKNEGFLKKITIGVAQFVNIIDEEIIAEKIINSIDQFVKEATNNPLHPTRMKFDENILAFAISLASGEEKSKEVIRGFSCGRLRTFFFMQNGSAIVVPTSGDVFYTTLSGCFRFLICKSEICFYCEIFFHIL